MHDICPLWICFGSVVCEMLNEDSHASFAINFGLVWVFLTVSVFHFCMRERVSLFCFKIYELVRIYGHILELMPLT